MTPLKFEQDITGLVRAALDGNEVPAPLIVSVLDGVKLEVQLMIRSQAIQRAQEAAKNPVVKPELAKEILESKSSN